MPDSIRQAGERSPGGTAEVELLRFQLELERLDHAWDNDRQAMLIHGKRGGVFEPTVGLAWWNGGILLLLGMFFVFQGVGYLGSGGGALLLPAVIATIGGVYVIVKRTADARTFDARRREYVARREDLLALVGEAETRAATAADNPPRPA